MIGPFENEYAFLSNFHLSPIFFEGIEFPSVEHAFQAAKTLDRAQRKKIAAASTAAKSKKMGRAVDLRGDWESAKIVVMRALLETKFQDRDLRETLLATGDEELVELNWWHDRFWGVCTGGQRCSCDHEGENMLGKLLMALRKKIRDED